MTLVDALERACANGNQVSQDLVLEVDATYGTLVTPGQHIRKGEPVGYARPRSGQPAYPVAVVSPVAGWVMESVFLSERHCFSVRIRPESC